MPVWPNLVWANFGRRHTLTAMGAQNPKSEVENQPVAVRPFGWAAAAMVLWWASLPPLGWWPLAWLAPVPLVRVVMAPQLAGRRVWLSLWFAGLLYWLVTLHWLRLPHPATSIGWVALSIYLAVYLPMFVAVARAGVHQLGMSAVIVAPVAWTGWEYAQTHLLTGFNMASLGHSQWRIAEIIQIADLGGAYAVTFLVMFVGACIARALPGAHRRWSIWPVAAGAIGLVAAVGYGLWRIDSMLPPQDGGRSLSIALIQGSIDTEMKADPKRNNLIFQQYFDLSREAMRQANVDLIVWPETMYRTPMFNVSADSMPPAETSWSREQLEEEAKFRRKEMQMLAERLGAPMLLGVETFAFNADGAYDRYNSAVLVTPEGVEADRYDKMHLVMFGEFIPLGEVIPWLYTISPLGGGMEDGDRPHAFDVDGAWIAPNICFESLVPHLIRRQVLQLRRDGREPDVLVNLTNDGWFWGSTELDLHLICGVFRAVEMRKPFAIAANTGFSAFVDSHGRVLQQGKRRETDILIKRISLPAQGQTRVSSPYLELGDWLGFGCLVASLGIVVAGLIRRRKVSAA